MTGSLTKKSAVVFGGSGLTGRFLTEMLANDSRFGEVTAMVRHKTNLNEKLTQLEFNPDNFPAVYDEIKADFIFCCLGTTIKQAGSKENFRKVDLYLVDEIAKAARQNNVTSFTVISSVGASPDSGNFYLRTKGEMEARLMKNGFEDLHIMRPSMLLGIRPHSRPLEDAGKILIKIFEPLMIGKLKKYKPVHAADLARFMIESTLSKQGINIYESDTILKG
ncbi:MAG: NAD(P)H-binding protein [Lentimicrobiaceae bacterium]|nr:NAD(P)H-binding protein [Lentimicrobiaceae bacterium]